MADNSRTAISNIFYLVLRRLRFPLILIIVGYGFCTIGMTFMPGVDELGRRTPGLTLFQSFYVMSYTGTSIGFGELPQPYSGAQRLWMTLSIYITVIVWTYSLLNVIALLQDRGFQNAMGAARFSNRVKAMREPFYIVAGCGETGLLVCRGLDRLNLRFVVIEEDEDRLLEMELEEFHFDPPMMNADASQAAVLEQAGLHKPNCKGIMALAEEDITNRSIAVAARLLTPGVPVLARVRDMEAQDAVMGPFGGDLVINPFNRFAEHMAEAIAAPNRYRLRVTLTGLPGRPVPEIQRPPRGRWIVCGYGRFGRAIVEQLRLSELSLTVVDNGHPEDDDIDVAGSGTDEYSLTSAGIDKAVGLVAGTDNDMTNLAIAVTARDLKRDIFIVTRQNYSGNDSLFESFKDDLSMVPSRIVAQEFLAIITTPLISKFLAAISSWEENKCAYLMRHLEKVTNGTIPEVWSLSVTLASARYVVRAIQHGYPVRIGDLLRQPNKRNQRQQVKVLMVLRAGHIIELPPDTTELRVGDHLLFASSAASQATISNAVQAETTFKWMLSGIDTSGGIIWRKLLAKPQKLDPQLPEPQDFGEAEIEPAKPEKVYAPVQQDSPIEDDTLKAEADDGLEAPAGVPWEPIDSQPESADESTDGLTQDDGLEAPAGVPWEPIDSEAEAVAATGQATVAASNLDETDESTANVAEYSDPDQVAEIDLD